MNTDAMTPPRALVLCRDERLSRLLETELAYLGIDARSTESTPPPDGELCLIAADGDEFAPKDCAELASACGCPLLLFGRECPDPAVLPAKGCFLRRPFALGDLEQTVRRLLAGLPAGGFPVSMSRNPTAPEAVSPFSSAAPALTVNAENGTFTLEGKTAALTPAEQTILEYLLARRGEAVPRTELAALLEGGGNSVDVYICKLRAKIEKPLGRRMIVTVRGVGYRLEV